MPPHLVGIAEEAEPDGSQAILIDLDAGGDPIEVTVPLQHVQELVERFQLAAMVRVQKARQNLAYPKLTARGVHVGHAGPQTQLLVGTEQLGVLVLDASDECLHQMKTVIDKVLSFRGGSTSKN